MGGAIWIPKKSVRKFLWESENIILTMFQAKEPLLERLNELKYRCFYYISSYQARFLINRTVRVSSRLRSSVEIIPSLMKYFCQTTPVLVRSDPFLSTRGSQTLMRGPLSEGPSLIGPMYEKSV